MRGLKFLTKNSVVFWRSSDQLYATIIIYQKRLVGTVIEKLKKLLFLLTVNKRERKRGISSKWVSFKNIVCKTCMSGDVILFIFVMT